MKREVPLDRVWMPRLSPGLEVHDLVLSKCAAGRERDWDYAREALRAQIVDADVLLARIPDLPVSDAVIAHVDTMLQATIDAAEAASGHG